MRIKNFKIRAKNATQCVVSWTSISETSISWIFINGISAVGPLMVRTLERSVTMPFADGKTIAIEIHDSETMETIPDPCEVIPQTKPLLSWRTVDDAERYRIYYENKLLQEIPSRPGILRQEIKSPITLNGQHGQWHQFHVESVDPYNNESLDTEERITFWAYDLPPVPNVTVQKNSNGLYDFMIG
jgi:hypothetical protein